MRARIGCASATAEARPSAYSPATETNVQTPVRQSAGQKRSSLEHGGEIVEAGEAADRRVGEIDVVEGRPDHARQRIGDQEQEEGRRRREEERGEPAAAGLRGSAVRLFLRPARRRAAIGASRDGHSSKVPRPRSPMRASVRC